jgi:glycosyltransferase involved in cell wall biosynthesis
MDVAVVTPRFPPVSTGGGERSASLLATQLADRERVAGVTVFSFDGTGRSREDGVTIRRLGNVSPTVTEYQTLVAYRRLRNRLRSFDIVHAYNMELHPAVGCLSATEGVPAVATLNSYHFFPSSVTNTTSGGLERVYELVGLPTTGRVLLWLMKRIDAFVALSRAIRGVYRENGFEGARIEHIPNMVDPGFGVPQDDESNRTDLLYVGSLTENKGVKYLIEALSLLPDEYDLRVVGDGKRMRELCELADALGVGGRTEFSGWVPYGRIEDVYARAGLFVHPGIWPEPLNRTVLEAMQAGLPVVCTDIGGPPEVLPREDILVEPANPEALADGIERAVADGTNAGVENRRHVQKNHAPSVVVPRMVDFYEELLP